MWRRICRKASPKDNSRAKVSTRNRRGSRKRKKRLSDRTAFRENTGADEEWHIPPYNWARRANGGSKIGPTSTLGGNVRRGEKTTDRRAWAPGSGIEALTRPPGVNEGRGKNAKHHKADGRPLRSISRGNDDMDNGCLGRCPIGPVPGTANNKLCPECKKCRLCSRLLEPVRSPQLLTLETAHGASTNIDSTPGFRSRSGAGPLTVETANGASARVDSDPGSRSPARFPEPPALETAPRNMDSLPG